MREQSEIFVAGSAPPEGATAFPTRLAALDVGSNAIRYGAAEFTAAGHGTELAAHRFAVRLGHDAFTTGRLSEGVIQAAVASAVSFRARLDDLGITRYRAVATSAVRESRNGGELVERIRRESGIHVETITGTEEARLVWLAVKQRIQLGEERWLLADLGGGSLEISTITRLRIEESESHAMGTVRLLEDLSGSDPDGPGFRHRVERYSARLALPRDAGGSIHGVILTGGNAEAIADLASGKRVAGTEPASLTPADLESVLDRLANLSFRERVETLGLREDRADVIVPAAIIFRRVVAMCGAERILVPRVGVREGVLYDLAADLAEHRSHEDELYRLVVAGALALGRRYRFDEGHARHVAELSLELFDQLGDLHRLDESSRRRLTAAALLHDVGQFVSYRRHHKHSYYVLVHSELPGLGDRDMRKVALVSRYHRRSEPRDDHEGYSELAVEEKREVRVLAAILRVADALDREHRRDVRSLRASRDADVVTLTLESAGDTALERWALEKKAPMFEREFGVRLRID